MPIRLSTPLLDCRWFKPTKNRVPNPICPALTSFINISLALETHPVASIASRSSGITALPTSFHHSNHQTQDVEPQFTCSLPPHQPAASITCGTRPHHAPSSPTTHYHNCHFASPTYHSHTWQAARSVLAWHVANAPRVRVRTTFDEHRRFSVPLGRPLSRQNVLFPNTFQEAWKLA